MDPFIIMQCFSLSFIIIFILKSILSDMNIITPTFCTKHPFAALLKNQDLIKVYPFIWFLCVFSFF